MPFLLLINLSISAQYSPLFPGGDPAPNVHHTGEVWLSHLSHADDHFGYNIAVARFAPGAKLDWHQHPAGQQLIITEGVGYYQERGQEPLILRQGDVVKCLPGVEHWHAASPDTGVVYLAISGNQRTQWLEPVTEADYHRLDRQNGSTAEQERLLIQLSKQKWEWMAAQDVARLQELFLEESVFVHMGGSWGKDREIEIIESGRIHYKQADIHEVSVNLIDDTAILLNRITLLAVVGGNEVTNPFMVTEVYKQVNESWRLASLSFTRLLE